MKETMQQKGYRAFLKKTTKEQRRKWALKGAIMGGLANKNRLAKLKKK